MKFKMLDEVECIVTGFKGKVNAISLASNGMLTYNVQPPVNAKGVMPEAKGIDEASLKLIQAHPGDEYRVSYEDGKFRVFDEVKDVTTGFVGVITASSWFLNGCFQYSVARMGKEKTINESFRESELVLVRKAKPEPEPKKKTGGPTMPGIKQL